MIEPLRVLHEHRSRHHRERFVRREQAVPPRQQVRLEPALAQVLAQHFHHPAVRSEVIVALEDMREPGQARVDLIAGFAEIGLDRIVSFPTRWSPTTDAQAAFAEDCRAAGVTLA